MKKLSEMKKIAEKAKKIREPDSISPSFDRIWDEYDITFNPKTVGDMIELLEEAKDYIEGWADEGSGRLEDRWLKKFNERFGK